MLKLIVLFWGVAILSSLSQSYYPAARLPQNANKHFMREPLDVFLWIAVIWMTCFSFLRTSYNDTRNYIKFFNNAVPVQELLQEEDFFGFGSNAFYELYNSFIHDTIGNYHVFFLFPAALNTVVMVKLFRRYSVSLPFTLIIFFSIGTYVMFIAALKQSIAAAILALAVPYAIDKKYVRFYLLVILAVMFHTHAFMFLFLPFLFRKPWGKLTWVVAAIVLFVMATYNSTMGTVMQIALDLGVNVADIEVFDGHSINVIRILVYGIPAMLALIFRKRLFSDSTREENLFANMSIIAVLILAIGLIQGANLYARMAAYFEFSLALTLPWMIDKLFTKESAKLVKTVGTVLFFGYFYYEFAVSKGFDGYGGYAAISLWQFFRELLGIG